MVKGIMTHRRFQTGLNEVETKMVQATRILLVAALKSKNELDLCCVCQPWIDGTKLWIHDGDDENDDDNGD